LRRTNSPIFSGPAGPVALAFENRGAVLLVQPLQEFLESGVSEDDFNRIERVAKFIMAPGFVDEILARMARGHDLRSALAARNNVMSPGWH